MSPWHFESVQEGTKSLPLKFGWNRAINNWDIQLTRVGGCVEKMGIKLSQPQLQLKLSWLELRLSLAMLLSPNEKFIHYFPPICCELPRFGFDSPPAVSTVVVLEREVFAEYQPCGTGGTHSPHATPHCLQNLKMADRVWKWV